jgi:HEAT repeat protein
MPFGPPDIDKLQAAGDVEGLVKALTWPQSQVRRNATEALARIGAPAATPLIVALRDPDSLVQGIAAETLVQIGAPAVEPLMVTLKDQDPATRKAAISLLGRIGDARAVAALGGDPDPASDLLVDLFDAPGTIWDPNEGVRIAATEALGQIGDGRAVGPLSAMLADSPLPLRKAAALALVAIYRSGAVREAQRVLILAKRETIIAPHQDHGHYDDTEYQSVIGGSSDCGRHTDREAVDRGIGVEFPI